MKAYHTALLSTALLSLSVAGAQEQAQLPPKVYDPDFIEFHQGFLGSGITWIFWLVIVTWMAWQIVKARNQARFGRSPLLSYEALILGTFWGLGELAFMYSHTMVLLSEPCALAPIALAYSTWLASYIVLWVLIESLAATIVVMAVRAFAYKRHNQPNKSE